MILLSFTAELAETAPSGMSPVHPARLIVEATRVFPPDGIMARDGGATTIFGWTYSQAKPHDVMWNQNFGHLGTGLPYAIGASVADGRKRPVMLITGTRPSSSTSRNWRPPRG